MFKVLKIEANLEPMAGYAGAVEGILTAIGTPKSKQVFLNRYMTKAQEAFMTDTIAANAAGTANLSHVFDWGKTQEQTSDIPLFKLIKVRAENMAFLSYDFLPSTRVVPKPDPQKTGISPAVIEKLKPHIFRMKAMVMETMENITIAPKNGKGLFIPSTDQERGYLMSQKPVTINPGGNATGGFAKWWTEWFDTRGQEVVQQQALAQGEFLAKTGQTIIRDLTTGRFSPGTAVSFGYAASAARNAELQMQAAIEVENA